MDDQVNIRIDIYNYPNLGYTNYLVYSDADGVMRYKTTCYSRLQLDMFIREYRQDGDSVVEITVR